MPMSPQQQRMKPILADGLLQQLTESLADVRVSITQERKDRISGLSAVESASQQRQKAAASQIAQLITKVDSCELVLGRLQAQVQGQIPPGALAPLHDGSASDSEVITLRREVSNLSQRLADLEASGITSRMAQHHDRLTSPARQSPAGFAGQPGSLATAQANLDLFFEQSKEFMDGVEAQIKHVKETARNDRSRSEQQIIALSEAIERGMAETVENTLEELKKALAPHPSNPPTSKARDVCAAIGFSLSGQIEQAVQQCNEAALDDLRRAFSPHAASTASMVARDVCGAIGSAVTGQLEQALESMRIETENLVNSTAQIAQDSTLDDLRKAFLHGPSNTSGRARDVCAAIGTAVTGQLEQALDMLKEEIDNNIYAANQELVHSVKADVASMTNKILSVEGTAETSLNGLSNRFKHGEEAMGGRVQELEAKVDEMETALHRAHSSVTDITNAINTEQSVTDDIVAKLTAFEQAMPTLEKKMAQEVELVARQVKQAELEMREETDSRLDAVDAKLERELTEVSAKIGSSHSTMGDLEKRFAENYRKVDEFMAQLDDGLRQVEHTVEQQSKLHPAHPAAAKQSGFMRQSRASSAERTGSPMSIHPGGGLEEVGIRRYVDRRLSETNTRVQDVEDGSRRYIDTRCSEIEEAAKRHWADARSQLEDLSTSHSQLRKHTMEQLQELHFSKGSAGLAGLDADLSAELRKKLEDGIASKSRLDAVESVVEQTISRFDGLEHDYMATRTSLQDSLRQTVESIQQIDEKIEDVEKELIDGSVTTQTLGTKIADLENAMVEQAAALHPDDINDRIEELNTAVVEHVGNLQSVTEKVADLENVALEQAASVKECENRITDLEQVAMTGEGATQDIGGRIDEVENILVNNEPRVAALEARLTEATEVVVDQSRKAEEKQAIIVQALEDLEQTSLRHGQLLASSVTELEERLVATERDAALRSSELETEVINQLLKVQSGSSVLGSAQLKEQGNLKARLDQLETLFMDWDRDTVKRSLYREREATDVTNLRSQFASLEARLSTLPPPPTSPMHKLSSTGVRLTHEELNAATSELYGVMAHQRARLQHLEGSLEATETAVVDQNRAVMHQIALLRALVTGDKGGDSDLFAQEQRAQALSSLQSASVRDREQNSAQRRDIEARVAVLQKSIDAAKADPAPSAAAEKQLAAWQRQLSALTASQEAAQQQRDAQTLRQRLLEQQIEDLRKEMDEGVSDEKQALNAKFADLTTLQQQSRQEREAHRSKATELERELRQLKAAKPTGIIDATERTKRLEDLEAKLDTVLAAQRESKSKEATAAAQAKRVQLQMVTAGGDESRRQAALQEKLQTLVRAQRDLERKSNEGSLHRPPRPSSPPAVLRAPYTIPLPSSPGFDGKRSLKDRIHEVYTSSPEKRGLASPPASPLFPDGRFGRVSPTFSMQRVTFGASPTAFSGGQAGTHSARKPLALRLAEASLSGYAAGPLSPTAQAGGSTGSPRKSLGERLREVSLSPPGSPGRHRSAFGAGGGSPGFRTPRGSPSKGSFSAPSSPNHSGGRRSLAERLADVSPSRAGGSRGRSSPLRAAIDAALNRHATPPRRTPSGSPLSARIAAAQGRRSAGTSPLSPSSFKPLVRGDDPLVSSTLQQIQRSFDLQLQSLKQETAELREMELERQRTDVTVQNSLAQVEEVVRLVGEQLATTGAQPGAGALGSPQLDAVKSKIFELQDEVNELKHYNVDLDPRTTPRAAQLFKRVDALETSFHLMRSDLGLGRIDLNPTRLTARRSRSRERSLAGSSAADSGVLVSSSQPPEPFRSRSPPRNKESPFVVKRNPGGGVEPSLLGSEDVGFSGPLRPAERYTPSSLRYSAADSLNRLRPPAESLRSASTATRLGAGGGTNRSVSPTRAPAAGGMLPASAAHRGFGQQLSPPKVRLSVPGSPVRRGGQMSPPKPRPGPAAARGGVAALSPHARRYANLKGSSITAALRPHTPLFVSAALPGRQTSPLRRHYGMDDVTESLLE